LYGLVGRILLAITVLAILSTPSEMLAQTSSSSWVGLRVVAPTGDTGDLADNGFGLTGTTQINLTPTAGLVFEGSWHQLRGKTVTLGNNQGTDLGNVNIFALMAGGLVRLGKVEVGAKGGYFFDGIREWDIMPFAQVAFWRVSFGTEYKAFSATNWFSGYINLRV